VELKEMVGKLKKDAARLESNYSSRMTSYCATLSCIMYYFCCFILGETLLYQGERRRAGQRLDQRRYVNCVSKLDSTVSTTEVGGTPKSMADKREAPKEMAISLKGDYSRNLQAVLKMLLKSANVSSIIKAL